MKRTVIVLPVVSIIAAALFSCGGKETGPSGPGSNTAWLDTAIIGYWEGKIIAPAGTAESSKMVVDIAGQDSAFRLIIRDTTQGTSSPAKDTMLILWGSWRLKTARDTILLSADSCKARDTASKVLRAKPVTGLIVSLGISIVKNAAGGNTEWTITLKDISQVQTLWGVDFSGVSPADLMANKTVLVKKTAPVILPLDLTVVGRWEGAMPAITLMHFKGAQIFVRISGGTDSSFTLITLDSTRGTTLPIRDTTLVLDGTWRLNPTRDSILLNCDTCRIIDTTHNILVGREVRGQVIPMLVNISRNQTNQDIEWQVALADLVPLAPLMGINLSGVPASVLQVVKIVLVKKSQDGSG